MEVIRARVLGYCMGVQRAVDEAEKALKETGFSSGKVYSLGPLIHNPSVINSLEEKGLTVLNSDDEVNALPKDSLVIVRAHGTTPQMISRLEKEKITVRDATCPRVHLSQKRAREFSAKGYTVVIAGDRNHGEVISISGYAEEERKASVYVVQSKEEAEGLELKGKVMLIAQTTFSPAEFEEISQVIQNKIPDATIFNSICSATMERQKALKELKGKAEGILVIGGKNSANTRRLYETAESFCSKVALVESDKEIPEDFFSLKTVALTAGASTPPSLVDAVEKALLNPNSCHGADQ